jgi:uncharacterized protein (DUF305 family)
MFFVTLGSGARQRPSGPMAATLAAAVLLAAATPARAMVGEEFAPEASPVLSPSYTVLPATELAAAIQADRSYVTGMRAHHAGALTMSDEYLNDPEASSPVLKALAQAIIHNQRYEIALLDAVAQNLDQPARILDLGFTRLAIQPAATEGIPNRYRFFKAPTPGPLAALSGKDPAVTRRDVQFAKAMTIHHQGALDMARAYQADRNGRNTYLGLLNVDILTDQTQEIALMRRVIATYPGDADAVPVPPSMVHGMEGMSHGGHAGHGAAPAPAPHAGHGPAHEAPAVTPAPREATPAPRGPQRPETHHHAH